jgi:hypothetical protein
MKQSPRPVSAATRAMLDEMREDAKPTGDKLDQLKQGVAKLRNMEFEKAALEERISVLSQDIITMKERTLVDLFDEAGTTIVGVEAEGNMPPYTCQVEDRYHANIPPEKAEEAYAYLRSKKSKDLIKSTFTIQFGLRESKQSERFMRSLDKEGIEYSLKQAVPWNTLTAWFKAEHKKKPLTVKAMGLLGATVGRVVKVVKSKPEKK